MVLKQHVCVAESLGHLASLPLARESIRYRPGTIQRHAREVRRQVTPEQFVELVGLIGVANMVCRLETICETG